jgi:cyclic dehypoxanthinyl futalosine synthase
MLQHCMEKPLDFEFLSVEEGIYLFEHSPLTELMYVANELRKKAGAAW